MFPCIVDNYTIRCNHPTNSFALPKYARSKSLPSSPINGKTAIKDRRHRLTPELTKPNVSAIENSEITANLIRGRRPNEGNDGVRSMRQLVTGIGSGGVSNARCEGEFGESLR